MPAKPKQHTTRAVNKGIFQLHQLQTQVFLTKNWTPLKLKMVCLLASPKECIPGFLLKYRTINLQINFLLCKQGAFEPIKNNNAFGYFCNIG